MKHLLLTTIAAVLLVGCGNPDVALIQAITKGNPEAVQQAIADGADVNAKGERGLTPLHIAHYANRPYTNLKIAELLITKGADVNAIILSGGNQGKTPLDVAIDFKHIETADLLRKHGGKTGDELKAEGK